MLGIFGLIIIIVVTVHVYRTAKQYGRNAIAWTLTTLGIGFGIQLILPFFIGIVIGVVMLAGRSSPEQIQAAMTSAPAIIINIACIILSVIVVFLVLRHISKIPEEIDFTPPPSPPDTFN